MFYIGIDLGTANSTVSVIKIDNYDDNPIKLLRPGYIYQYGNSLADYLQNEEELPSFIYFDIEEEKVYTGKYAKELYGDAKRPMQSVCAIKTRIGGESEVEIPAIRNSNEKKFFDMVQCSSLFIRTIVQSLQKQYPNEDITKSVVVTVPAAFNDDERINTQNAVLLGGFKSCIILDEPTAALLSHINSENHDDDSLEEDKVYYKLVYDIGGGTLDVSIVKVIVDEDRNYQLDVVGLSERMNLGGNDFDRILGAWFLMRFEKTNPSINDRTNEDKQKIIARIVSNAEKYKININNKIITCRNTYSNNEQRSRKERKLYESVTFELIDGLAVTGLSIDKNLLDEIYDDYANLDKIRGKLLDPIKTSLRNAEINKNDISEVILTGGMSNMYLVRDILEKFFTDVATNNSEFRIISVEDTRNSVSRGAALYNWGLDDNNYCIGIHKITHISQKLASNIYIKNGNDFTKLIDGKLKKNQGEFDYKIMEDNTFEFPLFLYSGLEDESGKLDKSTLTALSGKSIKLDKYYNEGDKIKLVWEIDSNKIITINVPELQEKEKISRLYTDDDIINNPITKYKINPIK